MEILAHVILIAFTAYVIIQANPGSSLFSWHPTCMAIAVFLLTEAVILFRKPGPKVRVYVHWFMAAAGLGTGIYGFLCIYNNKEANGKEHFTTPHGIAGVTTIGLLIVQALGGNLANLTILFPKLIPGLKSGPLKRCHRLAGAVSLTALYATLLGGLGSAWFTSVISSTTVWYAIATAIMYPYLYAVFNADYSGGKSSVKGKSK